MSETKCDFREGCIVGAVGFLPIGLAIGMMVGLFIKWAF